MMQNRTILKAHALIYGEECLFGMMGQSTLVTVIIDLPLRLAQYWIIRLILYGILQDMKVYGLPI